MPTYVVVYFPNFSPYWEKCNYCFECVNSTPQVFDTVSIPTGEGSFEGVVVDITTNPKYPIGVYKF